MLAQSRGGVLDLWEYATGEPWGEMSEDRAECAGQRLGELWRQTRDLLAPFAKR